MKNNFISVAIILVFSIFTGHIVTEHKAHTLNIDIVCEAQEIISNTEHENESVIISFNSVRGIEIACTKKMYELENPADYMDGLTAYSKRCIYVGEAEYCRLAVKMNI